jgi:hypothetical protein
LLREQAGQYSGEALDLLARASAGSLAPHLPAPAPEAGPPGSAQEPLQAIRRRAGDLVRRIEAPGGRRTGRARRGRTAPPYVAGQPTPAADRRSDSGAARGPASRHRPGLLRQVVARHQPPLPGARQSPCCRPPWRFHGISRG